MATENTLVDPKYARTGQKLNELFKELRDWGIEELIPLPKVVVLGSQSVGKSSLIEAISRIKVPRASQTCTRCPMEVVLSSANPDNWHCKVSLRIDHEETPGQRRGIFQFAETEEKDEVTNILRQAQLAILNPSKSFASFSRLSEKDCNEHPRDLKFSRNTVVLEISGAGVDLTFIDLPGIIASTEKDEDKGFIDLIRGLAKSYVSQKECLTLLTISMKDDIDNQPASMITKEFDRLGMRTIGVLTKADTVSQGEYDSWISILENKSHKLHHGYYVTRLPTTQEMGQSWEQTRIKEEKFFKSHEVWHKVDKLRCGTQNLASATGILLTQMIEETLVSSRMQLNNTSLPTLKKSINEELRGLQEQLDALPRAFEDNPQAHLLSLCNAFLQDIDNYTSGKQQYDPGQRAFLQDAAIHYRSLQTEVRKTKPEFLITPSQSVVPPCILAAPIIPSLQPAPSSPIKDSPPPKGKDPIQEISLQEVTAKIGEMTTRELYGIIPFRVHEYFISFFLKKWDGLCLDSFMQVDQILGNVVDTLCKKHFDRFQTSGLYLEVCTVVHEVLEEASAHAREEIRQYCGMENHRPLTLNKEEYAKTKDENVTEFSIKRNGPDSLPKTNGALFILEDIQGRSFQFRATEEILLKVLSAYGIHLSSAKELVRIHVDVYQAELDVIAHVIAYFDIASKHLIDTMPKIFEKRFANQFGQKLADVLTTRLNLIGDGGLQTCSRYSRDEPHIQERRRELTRKQKILTKALKTVEDFHK